MNDELRIEKLVASFNDIKKKEEAAQRYYLERKMYKDASLV